MNELIKAIAVVVTAAILQSSYSPYFPDNYTFLDVFRNENEMQVNRNVPVNPYNPDCYNYNNFDLLGNQLADNSDPSVCYSYASSDHSTQTTGYTGIISYDDSEYTSVYGIDVSKFQGKIDWSKVKDSGVDFAFVRVAYRGYGSSGSLNEDAYFRQNIEGAKNAGIDVGVYIYSQAINESEAIEEADYVLDLVSGYELDLPVVYDPEHVLNDTARTDNVTGEQFTKNARAFCDQVKSRGYTPMVYANMLWEAYELDLSLLQDVDLWYADYENLPQSPYKFRVWQYSQAGHVPGISGSVDLNIMYIPKN